MKDSSDKIKEIASKHSKWYKSNQRKAKEYGAKYSQWCKNNPDKVAESGKRHSDWLHDNIEDITHKASITKRLHRSESDFTDLLKIIHPKYIDDLLNGDLKSNDTIETKCPVCGNYASHSFHNVFRFRSSKFKNKPPMCSDCASKMSSSSLEKEIADYIVTFYSGELIRNSRNVISPLELDLYYPEKKIAIEFNGDCFHDEDHKSRSYHYDKYTLCKESGIILVSIFESYWQTIKDSTKSYLYDLFNSKENSLSFNGDLLNNSYSSPNVTSMSGEHIDDCYMYRDKKSLPVVTQN